MSTFTGLIDNVRQVPLGTSLDANAPTGTTVLTVVDTSDFDGRGGGTVSINGTLYPYIAVDFDGGTLTLGTPLTADAFQDDAVSIWDTVNNIAASEVLASIMSAGEADMQGDAIEARVSLSLVPLLALGSRDTGAGEVAECTDVDGIWVLTDLPGVTPQVRGDLILPGSIPQVALGFTLPGGTKVTVGGTAPASPADGDLWVYTDPVTPSNNTIYKWTASTGTWDNLQVGTNAIAAGSITADLIASNAIVAGKIAAGAITADSIAAGALDAISINAVSLSAATMQGSMIDGTISGTDFLVDATAGRILVYAQTNPVVAINDTTPGTRSWTVPAGVTRAKVECWGAGGGGSSEATVKSGTVFINIGGAGGGGGEYAGEANYTVAPGAVLSYTVGAGGAGGNQASAPAAGVDGGSSSLGTVVAHGGKGSGFSSTPGAGGTGSTNTLHFNGGSGAKAGYYTGGSNSEGGGGGSSAGNAANGSTATSRTGASAPTNGGAGGAGGTGTTVTAGSAPGGGGGGASTQTNGGAGAAGRVKITYYTTALIASIASVADVDPATGVSYPQGVWIAPTLITDWNTATQAGSYISIINSTTNGPTNSGYIGQVWADLAGNCNQLLGRITASDVPEIWYRQYSAANGWQPWHRVYPSDAIFWTGVNVNGQSIPNASWTKVSVWAGSGSGISYSAGIWTIPASVGPPRTMEVNAKIAYLAAAGAQRAARLYHNGNVVDEFSVASSSASNSHLPLHFYGPVAAGDTFEIDTYQSSGAATPISTVDGHCRIDIRSIS